MWKRDAYVPGATQALILIARHLLAQWREKGRDTHMTMRAGFNGPQVVDPATTPARWLVEVSVSIFPNPNYGKPDPAPKGVDHAQE